MTSCNLNIVFTSPVRGKSFSAFKDKLPKCYVEDLFTNISMVAAMLPIIERPNAVLKSEFVNIYASHWKMVNIDNKKLTAIQEHLLYCNYSPSFEDFF